MSSHPSFKNRHHYQARRDALKAGAVSLLGMSLPQLLHAQVQAQTLANEQQRIQEQIHRHAAQLVVKAKAKACILLFMWGGPAHQDTWDLKPEAPAEIRGEFRPIDTNVPGIQICEHFPLLAQRAHHLALIRSMTHTNVDHTTATHYLLTGKPPLPSPDLRKDWPHFGSVLARLGRGRDPLPPFVLISTSRASVPSWLVRFR